MNIKEINRQIAEKKKEIEHLEELLVKKSLLREWKNIDIKAMAGWEKELTAAERKTLNRIEQEFTEMAVCTK